MCRETLQQYYRRLNEAIDHAYEKESIFFNNDASHNAVVVAAMMNTSRSIQMYCGKMGLFRRDFPEKLKKEDAQYVKETFDNALQAFTERGGKIDAILEKKPAEDFWDNIAEEYKPCFRNGTISISCLEGDIHPIVANWGHFCIADEKMYRLETDKDRQKALIAIGGDSVNTYMKSFELLKSLNPKKYEKS